MYSSFFNCIRFFIIAILLKNTIFPQSYVNNTSSVNKKDYISYQSLIQQFRNLTKGPIESANTDSLILRRKDGLFTLKDGIIFKCPPINNETHAMLFIGDGNFQFIPPSGIEQMQLYRFYEKKSLNENIEFLFLLFSDSTAEEIENKLTFINAEMNNAYENKIKEALSYIFDNDEELIEEPIAYIFMEGINKDFFYSHFNDSKGDPMFFVIDPTNEEEIRLMKRYNYRFRDWQEPVCQYSFKKTKYSDRSREIKNGKIYISKYVIYSKIENNLDFSAHVKINFIPSFEEQKWIIFQLFKDLEVDSIFLDGKRKVEFFKGKESSSFWIFFDEPYNRDRSYTLNIYYHGELFEKNELGWVSIKSPNHWFPRCKEWENSYFDLTFSVPAKYKFCCVGREILQEKNEEKEMINYKYSTKYPIKNVSFNMGLFEEYKINGEEHLPITVYISEYGHNIIGSHLAPLGILSTSDMDKKIASDVANSLKFFSHVYGKIQLENIYVTEIPYSHGEAFPGLVHLSWIAFQGIQDEGMVEQFIAHEVAHQWWGITVDIESYHDQWLAEGFAEYSGLWYTQLALKNNDIFFDVLDDWKERIINNRKYFFGSGQEAGPIWLGQRTHSSETKGDYQLIIYEKGAWVLHMLRNMLVDLQTMKEGRFEDMMRDYFATYSGKNASTNDFQKIVEKHFGQKMDWFFNQWIYDTHIPDYQFSYKTDKTTDGKFRVKCRVLQSNVPPEFKMPIDVLIKFDNDQFARTRIELNGLNPEFDLPLMPLEPKKIILNDLHSVLCNVDYEKW